jgi:transposase
MREIVNGIFYVMRAGCPWRLLPNDLPPWGTIYRWFSVWRDDGCFERINHALVMADRERVGRDASPSAAIIDSQSVKTPYGADLSMPRVGDDPVARGQCRRRGDRMIDRRERPSAIVRPEPDSAKTKSRRRVAPLTDRAQVGAALARAS